MKYAISVLILACLLSCKHQTNDTNLPTICFNRDVMPALIGNCSMCHKGTSGDGGGELDFSNYTGVMRSVSSGNPDNSRLYTALSNMPPYPRAPLTKDQRTMIYIWIKQGALNDTTCH
jgi:hypothetical protein